MGRVEKFIKVDGESKMKLCQIFQVHKRVVERALAWDSTNELSEKIRFTAMREFRGVVWRATKEKYEDLKEG
jgi:hypothetical protein